MIVVKKTSIGTQSLTAWVCADAQPVAVGATEACFDTSLYSSDGKPGTDDDAWSKAAEATYSLPDPPAARPGVTLD